MEQALQEYNVGIGRIEHDLVLSAAERRLGAAGLDPTAFAPTPEGAR